MVTHKKRQVRTSIGTLLRWFALSLLFVGTHVFAQTGGTVTYVYTDPQGTPLAETDASGNITATFEYTPYGTYAPQGTSTPGPAPKGPGYTGHVNDSETNLIYMQARYYDAVTGRFLSVDPATPSSGDTFNFNRYAYAESNPIVHIDPNGRESASITLQGLAGIEADQQEHPLSPEMVAGSLILEGAVLLGPLASEISPAVGEILAPKVERQVIRQIKDQVTKEEKSRTTPGADGGESKITMEKDPKTGDTTSVTHTVTNDGEVIHQHQDHIGKAGSKRTFSDEWTGSKTVGQGKQTPTPKNDPPKFPPEPAPGSRY